MTRPEVGDEHVDCGEHDPDQVSSDADRGLLIREPTREDPDHGSERRGEPGFFREFTVGGRFRGLTPLDSASRNRPLPAVGVTRRDEASQQEPPGLVPAHDVRRRPPPSDVHRIRMSPTALPGRHRTRGEFLVVSGDPGEAPDSSGERRDDHGDG